MRIKGAAVSDPNTFFTSPGSRYKEVYSSFVEDDGTVVLKKTSEFDFQEYIESFRETTDMSWIVSQLKAGNPAVLQVSKPFYGDFREFPKSYAEVLQLNINAHKAFDELPQAVKQAYGNDFNRWFADFGSEQWSKMMFPDESVQPAAGESIEKEVSE